MSQTIIFYIRHNMDKLQKIKDNYKPEEIAYINNSTKELNLNINTKLVVVNLKYMTLEKKKTRTSIESFDVDGKTITPDIVYLTENSRKEFEKVRPFLNRFLIIE